MSKYPVIPERTAAASARKQQQQQTSSSSKATNYDDACRAKSIRDKLRKRATEMHSLRNRHIGRKKKANKNGNGNVLLLRAPRFDGLEYQQNDRQQGTNLQPKNGRLRTAALTNEKQLARLRCLRQQAVVGVIDAKLGLSILRQLQYQTSIRLQRITSKSSSQRGGNNGSNGNNNNNNSGTVIFHELEKDIAVRMEHAAIDIQRITRGGSRRNLNQKMNQAAVHLQRLTRGASLRNIVNKNQRRTGVSQMNGVLGGRGAIIGTSQRSLDTSLDHQDMMSYDVAHHNMQRLTRGAAMRNLNQCCSSGSSDHRDAAATRIQKMTRGASQRNLARRKQYAATCIQRVSRGASRRNLNHKMNEAAVHLQRLSRGVSIRNLSRSKHDAATRIQKIARGASQRNRTRKMERAAVRIQCLSRGASQRNLIQKAKKAAVHIQRLTRGASQRKLIQNQRRMSSHRNSLLQQQLEQHQKHHRCATKIQAAFRGWSGRKCDKIITIPIKIDPLRRGVSHNLRSIYLSNHEHGGAAMDDEMTMGSTVASHQFFDETTVASDDDHDDHDDGDDHDDDDDESSASSGSSSELKLAFPRVISIKTKVSSNKVPDQDDKVSSDGGQERQVAHDWFKNNNATARRFSMASMVSIGCRRFSMVSVIRTSSDSELRDYSVLTSRTTSRRVSALSISNHSIGSLYVKKKQVRCRSTGRRTPECRVPRFHAARLGNNNDRVRFALRKSRLEKTGALERIRQRAQQQLDSSSTMTPPHRQQQQQREETTTTIAREQQQPQAKKNTDATAAAVGGNNNLLTKQEEEDIVIVANGNNALTQQGSTNPTTAVASGTATTTGGGCCLSPVRRDNAGRRRLKRCDI